MSSAVVQPCSLPSHVYICSVHPLVGFTLAKFLTSQATLKCHGELTGDLKIAASESGSHILLVDTCSVDQWPNHVVQWRFLGGRVIVLVPRTFDRASQIYALNLGIHGIVPVSFEWERELRDAIHAVATGHLWVRRDTLAEFARRSVGSSQSFNAELLTDREQQIASFVRLGSSNKDIAATLGISERTVKFHVSNILQKCCVKSRRGLLLMKSAERVAG